MDLELLWFLLIAVLWTGYFILEGFDFGVGMLLPVLSPRKIGFGIKWSTQRRGPDVEHGWAQSNDDNLTNQGGWGHGVDLKITDVDNERDSHPRGQAGIGAAERVVLNMLAGARAAIGMGGFNVEPAVANRYVVDTQTRDAEPQKRRRVMINTVAPVWDGNEVWLIVAGGAMFAAFPEWYATLFSGFYLPLLLILVALIVRGMAFEYRSKRNSLVWETGWDVCLVAGSWVPAVLWGVAFANLVQGVPINETKQFTGTLFTLLNPYALLGGATTASLFLLHGAVFIALKTAGDIQRDAEVLARRLAPFTLSIVGVFVITTQLIAGKGWTLLAMAVVLVGLIGTVRYTGQRREGKAFVCTTVAIIGLCVLIFGAMWPNLMPSTTNPAYSLTVRNASSTPYTLGVMSWVALFFTPLVVGYQGWTYWVFRKRLSTKMIPDPVGITKDH